MIAGGWSKFTCVDEQEKAIFDQAKQGLRGVDYEPVAAATQVVAGTNYMFVCNATPMTANPISYPAMVHIFNPLDGHAYITEIKVISTN